MEVLFTLAKVIVAFVIMLQMVLVLLWVERKGSALIQDRVGANRAKGQREPQSDPQRNRNR